MSVDNLAIAPGPSGRGTFPQEGQMKKDLFFWAAWANIVWMAALTISTMIHTYQFYCFAH